MITVYGTEDRLAWPSYADHYRRALIARRGDAVEDYHRNYFVERAPHGTTPGVRQVSHAGLLFRARDDLLKWVENGDSPPPSTAYRMGELNQLVLPNRAVDRKGYQPVVRLLADGKAHHVEVAVGESVRFEILAEDPDNELVTAEIDFDGEDQCDQSQELTGRSDDASFEFRYDSPGDYVVAARVTDSTVSQFGAISNITAVRVIVR